MRRTVVIVAGLTLLISMIGSFVAQRAIYKHSSNDTLHDALFISSPQAVKKLSLGYSGLMADIYWTRVVQYFGSKHHLGSEDYKALSPLLDITVTLDPQLIAAYEFGSVFLAQSPPDGAGDPDAAVALVKRGIKANPGRWRLYYSLGYLEYLEKHDLPAAARAFEEGSKLPGAHEWMKTMAALMYANAGNTSTARYMWSRIYEEAEDKNIQNNALMRLSCLKVDEQVPQLEQKISDFHTKTGRWPTSWREMISADYLRNVPIDPAGEVYVLKSQGRVEVANPKLFRFAHFGLPRN